MPNWKVVLSEIQAVGSPHDVIRRKYLAALSKATGRNVIVYYSGWLQKREMLQGFPGFEINDADKNGFMMAIHKLDRTKGLDLILHTPGGEMAATESLVDYLRAMFSIDIRAIIPQIAMSAGTMVALACKEIIMGLESNLGPIDPQIGGIPAHGVIEEFNRAAEDIQEDPRKIPVWQPIIANYRPTLIGECEKAIAWSKEIVKQWLITGMFLGDPKAEVKARRIVRELGSHALTKSHSRHITLESARKMGIKVVPLEQDNSLQDLVLTVHHACIHTLSLPAPYKIIENQDGVAFIQQVQVHLRGT